MITVQSRADFIKESQLRKSVKQEQSLENHSDDHRDREESQDPLWCWRYKIVRILCVCLAVCTRGHLFMQRDGTVCNCELVAASAFALVCSGWWVCSRSGQFAGLLVSVWVRDSLSPPALAFAERRSKSFSRSWSDPTPVKTDSPHEPKDSEFTQTTQYTCTHRDADTHILLKLLRVDKKKFCN